MFFELALFGLGFAFGPLDDLEVLHVVHLEHDGGDGVFMSLNLILAIATTLGAERANVLEVHRAICAINLNESALVANLRIGY